MQKLLSNRKVFYSVIIVLTLLFGVFSFLTIKSYSNKEEPKSKEKVLERETFTTYISDGNGHYKKYTSADGSLYPSGYKYNQGISYCEDLDGNRLDIVPTYSNNKFTLESDKTAFCYLYFDEQTFADKLIGSGELWQSGLEGDGYRYVGSGNYDSATTPSNFICFGTTDKTECKNNESKYMYRIIGVFEGSDGEQHLKLISLKQLSSTYAWHGDAYSDVAWENSDLYVGLNGDYFLTNTTYDYLQNSTWLNKIENWTWSAVNTKTSSDSGPHYYIITTQEMYLHEMNRSSKASTIGGWSTPTAKIGLMYASDYQMSLGSVSLSYTGDDYTTLKTGWMHQSNNDTTASTHEWTLSRSGGGGGFFDAWYVYSDGNVNSISVYYSFGVRPVFHLTSDARIIDGDGSYSNPYILE